MGRERGNAMIDITRSLVPNHPNWPGDRPFTLEPTALMSEGSSANLMSLATSTHCGTHLDAPYHYDPEGGRLATVPLELLIGEALVIEVPQEQELTPEVLDDWTRLPERILFHSGQPDHWETFPETFSYLAPALVHTLADRGVKLIGTDCPSVDAFSSKCLPTHQACAKRNLIIIEGLRLGGVRAGRYRLVCLPLNLPEADASPVRALLEPL
ncbi:MAG: cyclase family protein [Truepera sp.]|nr:cyclase family protein [Truepera sp.]